MPRKKAPAAEAPRLVAYYRYSGGSRQTEQSIEGQRRDCEAYARAHGMTILREYVDRHISGKTDDRPAFQQLVADSAAHTFDAVICWKTDRLARNRYDSAVYKKKLRDNGVEILYAAESNISGAEGIIIEGLMEALAEYYSAELAEKARRGMRESALKGKALGSSRPLGLTVDADKHYVIEPKGAEAVRYIFEQYAAGLSSSSIVERLNAMGLRPNVSQYVGIGRLQTKIAPGTRWFPGLLLYVGVHPAAAAAKLCIVAYKMEAPAELSARPSSAAPDSCPPPAPLW